MNNIVLLFFIAFCVQLSMAQTVPDESELITLEDFVILTGQARKDVPVQAMVFKDKDTLIRFRFGKNTNPDLISIPYDYRSKEFTDLYKQIAFADNNLNDTVAGRMRYWKDEMRIYFSVEVNRKDKEGLSDFALNIAGKVDSLKIRIVKNIQEANYVVYYTDNYEYETRMSSKPIDYYLYWDHGIFLNKGFLRVDPEQYFNDEIRLQQLKRYFLKTLGYFLDTKDLDCGSYFSHCVNVDKELSPLDLELIQYHYSYGVCKGVVLKDYTQQLKYAEIMKDKKREFSVLHPKHIFQKNKS